MSLLCYLIAFIDFLRYGIFIPHVYEESERLVNCDVFVSEHGFRVVKDNYEHIRGERLIRGVTVTKCRCKICGKENVTWEYDDVPEITDDWWY